MRIYLSPEQEEVLVEFLEGLLAGGFPADLALLRQLATEMHNAHQPDAQRPVGKHWHVGFLGRHSELSIAWSTSLVSKRVEAGSSGVIHPWLERLQQLRQEYGVAAGDLWNMDEKGFVLGKGARSRVLV